jgi:hypothetical protein
MEGAKTLLKSLAAFLGLFVLYRLLPYDLIANAPFFHGIQPHHLQHKIGVLLTAAFIVWVISTAAKTSIQGWRRNSSAP